MEYGVPFLICFRSFVKRVSLKIPSRASGMLQDLCRRYSWGLRRSTPKISFNGFPGMLLEFSYRDIQRMLRNFSPSVTPGISLMIPSVITNWKNSDTFQVMSGFFRSFSRDFFKKRVEPV